MSPQRILKTLTFFSDDNEGYIYNVDTIEYEGKMWLVPEWFDSPQGGWRSPARIICLDVLPHEKTSGDQTDFVLNGGMPKAAFDCQTPLKPGGEYVVIERPDILFPSSGG